MKLTGQNDSELQLGPPVADGPRVRDGVFVSVQQFIEHHHNLAQLPVGLGAAGPLPVNQRETDIVFVRVGIRLGVAPPSLLLRLHCRGDG